MKKLLALVLALVMTLSLCTVTNAFKDDKDINEDYAEAVEVLNGMGVFKGYEDGSFKPNGNITRAEVAAIIYRIYTADVKDKNVSLYEGYGNFTDLEGAKWAKGYIGYCANAAFVKGYGDGKFGPSDPVTGYQALAMILRAMGYDQNGEFEGADWELHVAQIAQQLGILKNVKNVSLKTAASRELVAELLFQAIQEDCVTYTPALGYSTLTAVLNGKEIGSLGWNNFKLESAPDFDKWGRPAKVWFEDADEDDDLDSKESVYATIAYKADATYTEAVTECQIASDVGFKKTADFALMVNGYEDDSDYTVDALATKDYLGAQGTLLEVYYKYDGTNSVIVAIETYLAKVTKVTDIAYDKAGHQKNDASIQLLVYDDKTDDTEDGYKYVVIEDADANFDYKKGDMVLVNVCDDRGPNDQEYDPDYTYPESEIVGLAESFDGAQTKIYINADKHTVDGKTYMDADKFNLNQVGTETSKHTWFLDQYGNLIGVVNIEDTYGYAVLKDIVWVKQPRAAGFAEATLVYMDGTEATVTVNSMYGNEMQYDAWGCMNTGDGYNDVSDEISNNFDVDCGFAGVDLYKVATLADGSVDLTPAKDADEGGEIFNAVIATKRSAIIGGDDKIYTDKETLYLVREDTSVEGMYTFKAVEGFENIGNFGHFDEALVQYVDLNEDLIAEYVYVIGDEDSTQGKDFVYITSNADIGVELETKGGVKYYEVTGVIYGDGTTDAPLYINGSVTIDDLRDWLFNAVDKMYRIERTDGVLEDLSDAEEVAPFGLIDDDPSDIEGAVFFEEGSIASVGNGAVIVNVDDTTLGINYTKSTTLINDEGKGVASSDIKATLEDACTNGNALYVVGNYNGLKTVSADTIIIVPIAED